MNQKHCLFIINIFLLTIVHAQTGVIRNSYADTIKLENILSSFYDVSQLPQYLPNTHSAQSSSYDTTGGNDDGFSGKTSFIRRNADSSLVLLDVEGPGVINRIWTPTPVEDTIDFYLDGNQKPALSIKYTDLFSGKVYPFVPPLCGNDLGGFYCYFPILFNNGCAIVSRGKKMQFHQIQYRLYPSGTNMESFSAVLKTTDKGSLQKIATVWGKETSALYDLQGNRSGQIKKITKQVNLLPGQSAIVFNAATGGRIAGIECNAANALEDLNKLVDIEITWDDDKTPAVYCPLADFFGYAFGKHAMEALLLGTRNTINYCYMPMPFDKKATIRLLYRKPGGGIAGAAIPISIDIYYSGNKRNPQKEGRFYACWNRVTTNGEPHVFLNTTGRGHYVGSVLQAQGLHPGMTYFFEGDDSTVADGALRIHGTGSEDYFNGGWYALSNRWDGKLSLPLHGCLDYSLPYSRTGAYRFYLSDKISFEKNIFHSIEHGPVGNQVAADYSSLGFYYCSEAPVAVTTPTNALTKVYMPDTLIMYPQLMNAVIENDIAVKTSWAYNTGGESYFYTVSNESGIKISLANIALGKYRLLADFVRNDVGCEFSFWQGQHNVSGWLSAHALSEKIEKNYFIAAIENTESRNSITLHFKTAAGKNNFILNRLVFVKTPSLF